jgi:pimeloyl-ACP methyl ester carboxylesterase
MSPELSDRADNGGLRHHKTVVGDLTLYFVEAGPEAGEAVVLLHGWPESHFAWRRVIPGLAARYRVIAPDLRGFGDSSKPATGYDTRTVAGDIVGLLDHLGIGRAHLIGHDFGAATAYAIAAGWRDRVMTLAFIEMLLPGFGLEELVALSKTGFGLWHLAFHAAPDVPEMLIAGREREYLSWFFRNHAYDPTAISDEELDVYAGNYRQPGAARAAMGFYRALHEDAEQNRQFAEVKLAAPVLAVGGAFSIGAGVAACLRRVATNVEGDVVPECGHWVAEERPQWLADRLSGFLAANQVQSGRLA